MPAACQHQRLPQAGYSCTQHFDSCHGLHLEQKREKSKQAANNLAPGGLREQGSLILNTEGWLACLLPSLGRGAAPSDVLCLF